MKKQYISPTTTMVTLHVQQHLTVESPFIPVDPNTQGDPGGAESRRHYLWDDDEDDDW